MDVGVSYRFLARLLHDRHRRLHHAAFIGLILLFWLLFVVNRLETPIDFARLLMYSCTYIGIAYLNIYVIFPRYVLRGRPAMYIAVSGLSFVTSYALQTLIYFESFEKLRADYSPLWLLPVDMLINAITYFMFIGIGLSVKYIKLWLKSSLKVMSLEEENLRARLGNLKSQVSPHFLFNTFNNLYVLTKTEPEKAAEMLLGFSDLMRYQLSECENDKVSVEKEINYIENFLVLEKLRKNHLDLKINYDRHLVAGLQVEPLLFVSLVENAVKHGSQRMEKAFIHVSIERMENTFSFEVCNSRPPSPVLDPPASLGKGLSNLRRRLELSYPGRHALELKNESDRFTARLRLELA